MSNIAQQNALVAENLIFACVSDETAANYIISKTNPDDFVYAVHRGMMANIKALVLAGQAVTADRVVAGVREGVETYNRIVETTLSAANYEHYTAMAVDMACRRNIAALAADIGKKATDEQLSASDVLSALESKLAKIQTPTSADNAPQNAKVIIHDWLNNMKERMESGGMKGLSTGYQQLDELTHGLQAGRLYVLAGRPGSGKSAFALNVALNVSREKKVLLISLEMMKDEVMDRAVANLSGVFLSNIEDGFHGLKSDKEKDKQNQNLHLAMPHFATGNLTVWDNTDISVADVVLESQRLKRAEGVDLVIVDYLGLMSRSDDAVQELGHISRALKNMAAKLETPVIALHQVNRDCEKREDKRPRMGDLRGSGMIEENANVVMFTYRDDYYEKNQALHKNEMEVIIDKNRSGRKGKAVLNCDLSRMRITDKLTPFDNVGVGQ